MANTNVKMALDELIIEINNKKITLNIDNKNIHIKSKKNLTCHELQLSSAMAFVYLGGEVYGKNYTDLEIMEKSYEIYTQYNTIMKRRKFNGFDIKSLLKFK